MRRRRQGGAPLADPRLEGEESVQQRLRRLDRVEAVLGIARMGGASAQADRQVDAAEAAGPDARRGAAVEVDDVSFQQALLGEIADAGIETAFLVGAAEQHGIVGERQVAGPRGAQRQQRRRDRAFHIRGAEAIEAAALTGQRQGRPGPAADGRYRVDMEVETADQLAGAALGDQVDALAMDDAARCPPEALRDIDAAAAESQWPHQLFHEIGEDAIAGAGRKRGVDRDHAPEIVDASGCLHRDQRERASKAGRRLGG